MKKMVCLVILLLAAALLTACTEGGEAPVNPGDPSFAGRDADAFPSDWPDSVPPADNEGDYDSKITRIYTIPELKTGYWNVQLFTSFFQTLDSINEQFPIECLRRMDDGRYYAMYKMEGGGLFYIFFTADQVYTHNVCWVPGMASSVYSSIKGEMDYFDAKEYDEVLALFTSDPTLPKAEGNALSVIATIDALQTLHYTKDGLVSILYQTEDWVHYQTDGPVLHKDYALDYALTYVYDGVEYDAYTLDYSVLEKDLPPW